MAEEKENLNVPEESSRVNDDYIDLLKKEYTADDEKITVNSENKTENPGLDEGEYILDENATLKKVSPPPMKKDGEFIDVSSNSKNPKNPFNKLAKWYKNLPKKKKIIVSIIAIILCILIVLSSVTAGFVIHKFNLLGDDFEDTVDEDIIYDDEEFDNIDGSVGASGFNEALKEWATTGNNSIMTSKNVINILLIGADSRKGTNTGNTDVMMIVSLNKKTKTVKLISLFRDSYLYIENGEQSKYGKLNSAYSMGGAKTLITTIEHNYKIDIDNFVMVNFQSFAKIIDAMGGVTITVEKYEADYMKGKFSIDMPYGENITVTGKQALCFCRTRACYADADVHRTENQREVINAIMDRVKTASLSDLNKYIDVILPYIYTGYSQSEILSLGMKAITGGWAKYERSQLQMPPMEARTSGYAGSAWIWVIDYQLAANLMQTEIYGSSNIILEDGRRTLIDVYKGREATGKSTDGNKSTADTTEATTSAKVAASTTENSSEIVSTEVLTTDVTGVVTETTPVITEAPLETEIPTTEAQTEDVTEAVTEATTAEEPAG